LFSLLLEHPTIILAKAVRTTMKIQDIQIIQAKQLTKQLTCKELECAGKEDIAQRNTTTTHQANYPKQECLQGMRNSRGSFNGIHNHKLQAMKKPPKDAQLQGRRPITSKDNLNSILKHEKRPPRAKAQLLNHLVQSTNA
jgi:hypothetical protein